MEEKLQTIAINSLIDGGLDSQYINEYFDKRILLSPDDIFEYHQAVKFVLDIGTQIATIAEYGFAPIFILHEHISRIQDDTVDTFIITNFEHFIPIKNGKLTIKNIFKKSKYLAPELLKSYSIPLTVDIQTIHYNIVKLCLQNLQIDNNLDNIYPSKLYYLFRRVLNERLEIVYI